MNQNSDPVPIEIRENSDPEAQSEFSRIPLQLPVPDAAVVGVFLGEVGRKIFLKELFGRLREPLLYPPRQAALELRDIIREQAYHLARVIESRDAVYCPFVPHVSGA